MDNSNKKRVTRLSLARRKRKYVSYKESDDDDQDNMIMKDITQSENNRNSECEPEDDIPLKALINKVSSKMSRDVKYKIDDITVKSNSSLTNTCRPNISDGESSDEGHATLGFKQAEVDCINESCKGSENKKSKCVQFTSFDGEGIPKSSDKKLGNMSIKSTSVNSKKSGIDITTQLSRTKRKRKDVSYKESSDDDDEGGIMKTKGVTQSEDKVLTNDMNSKCKVEDGFTSTDDIPLKSLIHKVSSKMSEEVAENKNNDITIRSILSLANICRPNISDGESSESSDEDHSTLEVGKVDGINESCKEIGNKKTVCVQATTFDEEFSESSDKKLSLSSKLCTVSNSTIVNSKKGDQKELEFIKSSPEGNENDTHMGDVKEGKRIVKEKKRIKFEDNEIGANTLTLSAKLPVQTRSRKMEKDVNCEDDVGHTLPLSAKLSVQTRSRKKVGNDVNSEEVDVKRQTRTRKKRNNDKGTSDQELPLAVKLPDQKTSLTKRGRTRKAQLADLDDNGSKDNWEDVGNVKTKTKKSKVKKEDEAISDEEIPLSSRVLRKKPTRRRKIIKEAELESSDDSELEGNWEDVDEVEGKKQKTKENKHDECKDVVPITGLEVSMEVDSIHKKKKRKSREEKMFIWVRQMCHRVQKYTRLQLHKTHLLCILANALNQNKCCNSDTLKAICLSMIPHDHFQRIPSKWDINFLRRFTIWFQKDIPELPDLLVDIDKEAKELLEKFKLERMHIFVIMMRSLGFLCRIIYSLQPVSAKIKKSDLKVVSDPEDVQKNKKISKQEEKCTPSTSKTPTTRKSRRNSRSSKLIGSPTSPHFSSNDDLDPDFAMKNKIKVPNSAAKAKRKSITKNDTSSNLEKTCNIWTEVYMETLKRWVCVELTSESINSPSKCEDAASKPLQYVIGIDNNQTVKDVTCRYAEKWLTMNRKLRVDREWWAKTLDPFKSKDNVIDSSEDAQLRSDQLSKEIPTTISQFKDHPLYALQRHLLKFEAIYPEATVPVGYVKQEAIYPRDCVHVLHTQETWMKQARSLKPDEVPYKIVKGRKKFRERHLDKEVWTPCFGIWQTEVYVPPPVVDGKITKNQYGNVELYKPSMLPEGAVHIPLSNIQSVARKLKIDYAPAMMGWDCHGGYSHPIFEGIVVAKEYEEILLDTHNKQEVEREAKEKKKREEAIYGNWKTLIKGLLIRSNLKDKYSFEEDQSDKGKTSNKRKTKKKTTTGCKVDKKVEVKNNEDDMECITSMSEYWPNKQMKI